MLNKFDDYPIHQTPEPLAQPASSERNQYDRTWFNGYSADGDYYFGIGMAIYPHRGILDCAFSVVERGGRQHCFYGSRRAPLERSEMQVGPFKIEIIEPMRQTRVTLDSNPSGITCDLTFSARTSAIQEGRQTLWSGPRRVLDSTRFDQFGEWQGQINHPDGGIKVEPKVCRGTKDRSWGHRGVGEPETGGAPQTPGGAFFLWAPLFWDDHISHAIFFDGMQGQPLHREALIAPLYATPADVPAVEDGKIERMAYVRHRVTYHPGTRLAAAAELDFEDLKGATRTICMEPILKFQMKGLGYSHPTWAKVCGRVNSNSAARALILTASILWPEKTSMFSRSFAPPMVVVRALAFSNKSASAPMNPVVFQRFSMAPSNGRKAMNFGKCMA